MRLMFGTFISMIHQFHLSLHPCDQHPLLIGCEERPNIRNQARLPLSTAVHQFPLLTQPIVELNRSNFFYFCDS